MANPNAPFGFRATRHLTGGNVQENLYTIASGYAANIFTGNPVVQVADGSIQNAIGSEGSESVQPIGIFAGCKYIDATGNVIYSKFWPASTTVLTGSTIEAYVYDDPFIVFKVMSDSTGAALVDRGNIWAFNLNLSNGSAVTGLSASYLDHTVAGTSGNTLQFRILRLNDDGVNVWGPYSVVEVVLIGQDFLQCIH
jgi:hypothetical protein